MYGIIDCDNCYVSCERVFRPDLKDKPVVVLSNNDGCVVARSNEAKKMGIKAGTPYFQLAEQFPNQKIVVFSSNYELYGELTADRIAEQAQYFSFGTNDLTQLTFGYSRDDIASFLPVYLEKKILKVDPFQVLDQNGVGQLVKMAVEKGRAVRPNLRTGICGEHGGEPSSVKFCAKIGLNYASCSPFRVPIARLAAAQAAVEE